MAMPSAARSPLNDLHLTQGAAMGDYHGAAIPARFADPEAEYRAARAASGIFDLAYRSKFIAKGRDAARFLHRIVSNDIKSLTPGRGIYATLLDARGHILADFDIYADDDQLILDTDADLRDKAVNSLRRYIVGDQVVIEPVELWAIGFEGPKARGLLEKTLHVEIPDLAPFAHFKSNFGGFPVRVVRASQAGGTGYELWAASKALPALWGAACGQGPSYGMLACGTDALETLRIEAGMPRYGDELGEDTIPLEANLMNALSFNKGCYIGQEIVERTRSRGHVNWVLAGIRGQASDRLHRGEKLVHDGKEAGEITSACFSWTLGRPIALGYLRRELAEPGTQLLTDLGAAVEVTTLPFVPNSAESAG